MTADEERAYQARVAAAMEAMERAGTRTRDARAPVGREAEETTRGHHGEHAAAKQNAHVDADENVRRAERCKRCRAGGPADGPGVGRAPVPREPVSAKPNRELASDMFAAEDDEDAGRRSARTRAPAGSRRPARRGAPRTCPRPRRITGTTPTGITARVDEVLDGEYVVSDTHGRGVFSTVVKARDTLRSRRQKLRFGFRRVW